MILSEHKVRPDYARRRDRQSFHLTRLARSQEQKAFIDKWIGSMSKALYEAQKAEDAAATAQRPAKASRRARRHDAQQHK